MNNGRSRRKGFLITGTDTGVGKTYVGCSIAAVLHRNGLRIAPFKPAETGCKTFPGISELVPADAVLLSQASGTDAPLERVCPYRFPLPVAPWVAAQHDGREIDPALLVSTFHELAADHDLVIVETAGGILVPLTERFHYGDLARELSLPVLVVAGSKLGVINHTRLTLEYLRSAGLMLLGCVLNHPYPGDQAEHVAAVETNAATLRRLAGTEITVIPRETDATRAEIRAELNRIAEHVIAALR